MAGERRQRVLSRLIGDEGSPFETKHLCALSADLAGVSGAGILLITNDSVQGSVCSTSSDIAALEQLQYTLGEGPAIDAYRLDLPVLEPDVVHTQPPRWLAFTDPVIDAGFGAVFGFPLRVGGARFGALSLYRNEAGPLNDEQHADTLVMADIAAQAILVLQSTATPGHLAVELEVGSDYQYVVHQASGMVAAQLEMSVGHALMRLRAHAFAHDRFLPDVAREVVGRRLRFDPVTGNHVDQIEPLD